MKILWLSILLSLPLPVLCQNKISGRVLTQKGEPLRGANVFIPNTTNGVQTNANGEFVLTGLPMGNTRIAISFIGFKTAIVTVHPDTTGRPYLIKLEADIQELESVVINNYDKQGWEHWGELFIAAFIGNSAYADRCIILNKEAIHFTYSNASSSVRAYASSPLVLLNKALGYRVTVTLADFVYNTLTKNVDYQLYSFFEEMKGSNVEAEEWKRNRRHVYALSMMHFMRTLYSGNLDAEGFELRRLERKKNREKQRVQELYQQEFNAIKDSVGIDKLKEKAVNKLIEKKFPRDSLKYYHKVLEQEDRSKKLHKDLLSHASITRRTDSITVVLSFNDYLHVTYKKAKEPEEYVRYKNEVSQGSDQMVDNPNGPKSETSWPVTELILQQGIPIEINETGYFNNIDLYINGFWGWWEKMATKLPYGYQP